MVSHYVIMKSSVIHPRSDSRNWPSSSEWRRKWLMAKDLPTFRHRVVLVTRDFCPRPWALCGAVLILISYVWISKIHFRISTIHFWISKNEFRISQNNYGYLRISTNRFLDIHNSFLDIQKYIKIHFSISKSHAEVWISIIRFLDIRKSVYFRISKNHTECRISIIRFLDIHNSYLDIQKSVYFRISKNPFLDIQKSCWI